MERTPGKKARVRWGAGRVAFIAQLDEVRALVAAGWPLSAIYEERKQSLAGITYAAFGNLVRKYISGPQCEVKNEGQRRSRVGPGGSPPPTQTSPSRPVTDNAGSVEGTRTNPGPSGPGRKFEYNSAPEKDKLF